MADLFITTMHLFTSQDGNWWTTVVCITCGLLWCFPLVSNRVKSIPMKKQMFIFEWNIPLRCGHTSKKCWSVVNIVVMYEITFKLCSFQLVHPVNPLLHICWICVGNLSLSQKICDCVDFYWNDWISAGKIRRATANVTNL